MAGNRKTVHDRVLAQYDIMYGSRPEKPTAVDLKSHRAPDAAELVAKLRSTFGIPEDEPLPEGTLDDLIDYLHERWDGMTLEDEVEE